VVDRRRVEAAASRPDQGDVSHRWRFIPTVDKEIDDLSDEDAVSLHAQLRIVQQDGLKAARHLVEDIYEVEAHGIDNSYRLLFSSEGKKGRVLLAVVLHEKHTQRTPPRVIALAKRRRDGWRANRGSPT
jgi:phage-related protein